MSAKHNFFPGGSLPNAWSISNRDLRVARHVTFILLLMPPQDCDVDSDDSGNDKNYIDSISNVIENNLGSENVLLSHGPPTLLTGFDMHFLLMIL